MILHANAKLQEDTQHVLPVRRHLHLECPPSSREGRRTVGNRVAGRFEHLRPHDGLHADPLGTHIDAVLSGPPVDGDAQLGMAQVDGERVVRERHILRHTDANERPGGSHEEVAGGLEVENGRLDGGDRTADSQKERTDHDGRTHGRKGASGAIRVLHGACACGIGSSSLATPLRASVLASVVLTLLFPIAVAHGTLVGSTPAPESAADPGLDSIELRFAAPVERIYTSAAVKDAEGRSLIVGPIEFLEDRPDTIRLHTTPLAAGDYHVEWRTLSRDGHTARGAFSFGVGTLPDGSPPHEGTHDHSEHTTASVLREGTFRAIFLIGLLTATGGVAFVVIIQREREVARLTLFAWGAIAFLGTIGGTLAFVEFEARTGLDAWTSIQTWAGATLAARTTLLYLASMTFLVAMTMPPSSRVPSAALGGTFGLAALVVTALGGHAAAATHLAGLSFVMDLTHLLAGALWVGGVVALLLLSGGGGGLLAPRVRRFTPWAIASVLALALTGAYAAFRRFGSLDQVWSEAYGRVLLAKALLLLPILALGYYHKGRRADGRPARRIPTARVSLGTEAGLMLGLLVIAGVLTATVPPTIARENMSSEDRPPLTMASTVPGSHIELRVTPDPPRVGSLELLATIHSTDPAGGGAVERVGLEFVHPSAPLVEGDHELQRVSAQQWTSKGLELPAPGRWDIFLVIDGPASREKAVFTLMVGPD